MAARMRPFMGPSPYDIGMHLNAATTSCARVSDMEALPDGSYRVPLPPSLSAVRAIRFLDLPRAPLQFDPTVGGTRTELLRRLNRGLRATKALHHVRVLVRVPGEGESAVAGFDMPPNDSLVWCVPEAIAAHVSKRLADAGVTVMPAETDADPVRFRYTDDGTVRLHTPDDRVMTTIRTCLRRFARSLAQVSKRPRAGTVSAQSGAITDGPCTTCDTRHERMCADGSTCFTDAIVLQTPAMREPGAMCNSKGPGECAKHAMYHTLTRDASMFVDRLNAACDSTPDTRDECCPRKPGDGRDAVCSCGDDGACREDCDCGQTCGCAGTSAEDWLEANGHRTSDANAHPAVSYIADNTIAFKAFPVYDVRLAPSLASRLRLQQRYPVVTSALEGGAESVENKDGPKQHRLRWTLRNDGTISVDGVWVTTRLEPVHDPSTLVAGDAMLDLPHCSWALIADGTVLEAGDTLLTADGTSVTVLYVPRPDVVQLSGACPVMPVSVRPPKYLQLTTSYDAPDMLPTMLGFHANNCCVELPFNLGTPSCAPYGRLLDVYVNGVKRSPNASIHGVAEPGSELLLPGGIPAPVTIHVSGAGKSPTVMSDLRVRMRDALGNVVRLPVTDMFAFSCCVEAK